MEILPYDVAVRLEVGRCNVMGTRVVYLVLISLCVIMVNFSFSI